MAKVPEHFFQQSAVLPYRKDRGRLEVLVITSRRKKRWVIPKGIRELDLDSASSAAKEALEEAGIEGEVSKKTIGTYEYKKWGGVCSVEVFSMDVQTSYDVWPESYRDRFWVSPEEAAERVNEPELKRIILSFARSMNE
jgi:8-oxo-dGTP pyrophosphatase MutT (NUDIX family)